jgi:hypothetical protein
MKKACPQCEVSGDFHDDEMFIISIGKESGRAIDYGRSQNCWACAGTSDVGGTEGVNIYNDTISREPGVHEEKNLNASEDEMNIYISKNLGVIGETR